MGGILFITDIFMVLFRSYRYPAAAAARDCETAALAAVRRNIMASSQPWNVY